jgi:hypothetical protein
MGAMRVMRAIRVKRTMHGMRVKRYERCDMRIAYQ